MKIIHLSDLHFGTHQGEIVKITMESVRRHAPDLIIISGDFTQIANTKEFKQAKDFLDSLETPFFCVPGNHDVPQRNVIERFFNPYKKYKTYIHGDLCPEFANEDIILAGLNSARRALPHWNWANGALSPAQLKRLEHAFHRQKPESQSRRWRICTFHHPIHKIQDLPIDVTVFGAKAALQSIQDLKVDLVLTGHVHHASITSRGDENHQCIYLSASTAMSSRLRGQENGYNLITLDNDHMIIEIFSLGDNGFYKTQSFEKIKERQT